MKQGISILVLIGILLLCIQCTQAQSDGGDSERCPNADLAVTGLEYPPQVTSGGEFPFTFTVTNNGYSASEVTQIQIVLPRDTMFDLSDGMVVDLSDTVPPLEPEESVTLTVTVPIPSDIVPGYGSFQLIIDKNNTNFDCLVVDNWIEETLRILPVGVTPEEYGVLTGMPVYKITDLYKDHQPVSP